LKEDLDPEFVLQAEEHIHSASMNMNHATKSIYAEECKKMLCMFCEKVFPWEQLPDKQEGWKRQIQTITEKHDLIALPDYNSNLNHVHRLTRDEVHIDGTTFDGCKYEKYFQTMKPSVKLRLFLTTITTLHLTATKHFMEEKQFVDAIEYYQRLVALRHFRVKNIFENADWLNDVYDALKVLNKVLNEGLRAMTKQTVIPLAKKLGEESGDLAKALCNIGNQMKIKGLKLREYCGNPTDALDYFQLALLIHENYSTDKLAVASILGEMVPILTCNEKFNEAIACSTKALEIEKESRQKLEKKSREEELRVPNMFQKAGDFLVKKKKLKKALKYYMQALEYYKQKRTTATNL
jgi:hypothetical protein